MEALCPVLFVVGIIVIGLLSGGNPYARVLKRGVMARGILLSVDSLATSVVKGVNGVERRDATVDVEVPGQPPYEVTGQLYIPTNLRDLALPGATVEVRVDPKKPTVIALVGPGIGLPAAAFLTSPHNGRSA